MAIHAPAQDPALRLRGLLRPCPPQSHTTHPNSNPKSDPPFPQIVYHKRQNIWNSTHWRNRTEMGLRPAVETMIFERSDVRFSHQYCKNHTFVPPV
jgi:hypothetical protein